MSARPVLTLGKPGPGEILPSEVPEVPKVPAVPADAKVSYCNWRVGSNRPTRRYLTAEEALAEAKRIATVSPGATVYTYKLRVIGTNGEGMP